MKYELRSLIAALNAIFLCRHQVVLGVAYRSYATLAAAFGGVGGAIKGGDFCSDNNRTTVAVASSATGANDANRSHAPAGASRCSGISLYVSYRTVLLR